MPMNLLPDCLWIGPYRFGIEYVEKLSAAENASLGLRGEVIHNEGRIRLRAGMSPEMTATVAFHEVVHVIDDWMETELREKQVARLSSGILVFLRMNPQFGDAIRKLKLGKSE